MNNLSLTTVFVVGFLAGGVTMFQVAKYLERFRRARRDFRAARHGLKTLVEMMFRRGLEAAKWASIGALVVGGVVALVVVKGS